MNAQRYTNHHWHKGFQRALHGLPKDKRRRVGAHAKAYTRGYKTGREVVLHGLRQKIGDAYGL